MLGPQETGLVAGKLFKGTDYSLLVVMLTRKQKERN